MPEGTSSGSTGTTGKVVPWDLIGGFFRKHGGRYILGFSLLAATNVLAAGIPWFMKKGVDAMKTGDRHGILLFTAAIVAVALAQACVRTLSRLAILGAGRHVTYELRGRLFHHLQRLPLAYYQRRASGDITSRAINDMLLVRSFFGFGLMNLANTFLVYITVLSMMFAMDPRLTLYALAPYPLFMVAVNRIARRIYGRTMAVQDQMATLTTKAQENISGIQLIKTFARESAESARWSALSAEYLRRTLSLARTRGALVPLMGIMGTMGTLVVVGLGGAAVMQGRLSLGDFVAFNAYLAYLVWPTLAFGWILNTFQRGAAALGRICEILSEPLEDRSMPADWALRPLNGAITIRGLDYTHASWAETAPHLRGIQVTIPRGTSLGIVGSVGAGKTTLVNMLTRIHTPPQGAILIDGQDIRNIPLARLRCDIAMVPQEAFLFSRTLRENIVLDDRDADGPAIDEVLSASCLRNDLPQLPDGVATLIGERGYTLSGGQRQRATIARALLKRSPILILDDALSSLDAEVEHDVVAAIRRFSAGRTTIIVSHRVAALSWTDQIIVMDDGTIVERGTHEELMRAGGLYAGITRRQSLADRLEGS
ncbi:MAG: ABC transporter ATP-binding protein [Acidobacteriota bacterium]